MDFIYWRHPTVPGIKVEEITGGEHYRGKVWLDMARQVYCENGRDVYREIGHFRNGAPFLYGETSRISVTHCDGFLAVATLPPTPEVSLDAFSDRAAMGIDAERADRTQVLRIRERFLSDEELAMIPEEDLTLNVQAWTVKEAAYKAAFAEGIDFRSDIRIIWLPRLAPAVPVFDPVEFGMDNIPKELPEEFFGEVRIGKERVPLRVYSYLSDGFIVTLCYSPRCAKFGKAGS
jgi:hypothetical protein